MMQWEHTHEKPVLAPRTDKTPEYRKLHNPNLAAERFGFSDCNSESPVRRSDLSNKLTPPRATRND